MNPKIFLCVFLLIVIEEISAIHHYFNHNNNHHNPLNSVSNSNGNHFILRRKRAISQKTLDDCLNQKKFTGDKVFESSSNYSSVNVDENSAIKFLPIAILFPNTAQDVQTTVQCAKSSSLNITPRSGGHSYEAYSLGGKDGALVVDLKNFKQITIDEKNNLVKVGAGNRLGNIYLALSKKNYVVPAGTCPSVGVSGHIMGGGVGNLVRKFGKLSDQLVSVDIVLASGELVTVDSNNNPDLFFGLRGGGGGNFGIATSFTIKIHKIPATVTSIDIQWQLTTDRLHNVFKSVHEHGNTFSTDLSMSIVLSKDTIEIVGVYLGDKASASKELSVLLKDVGGASQSDFIEESWFDSVVRFSYESREKNLNPSITPYPFKAKSFLVGKSGLSNPGLDALAQFLGKVSCSTFAEFDLYSGGAKVNPDKSIFEHLDFSYGIQLLTSDWKSEQQGNTCIKQINTFGKSFQSDFTSPFSYINYIDKDLDNWPTRYYGDNLKTLQTLKSKFDPDQLFKFPQSIPIV